MLRHSARNEKGFTLMELLIAVAIVVILAGVGIPIYLQFQASAKHAEASTNLNGIKLAEESFKLANGTYLDCVTSPRVVANLDQSAAAWQDLGTGFTNIGFQTSGDVRFVYGVNNSGTTSFLAEALADTDGDGNNILFVANQEMGPHVIGTDARDAALIPAVGTAGDTAD